LIYQVTSSKVRIERWFANREEAIAAFERKCKRLGLTPPLSYPPGVSGDVFQDNRIAYPRWTWAARVRDGHGYVLVERRNEQNG